MFLSLQVISPLVILLLPSSILALDFGKTRRHLSETDNQVLEGTLKAKNAAKLNVHFIHLPKTAGESVMLDSPDFLLQGQTLMGNREWPYIYTKQKQHVKAPKTMAFVLLRNPIKHILSQFLECKYDEWGQLVTNRTGFPGYGALDNILEGFDEWVAHFALSPDTFGARDPRDVGIDLHSFNCYDPWNMQARKMTMNSEDQNGHFSRNSKERFPSLTEAKANLQDEELILGITEHYAASMCLMEFHAMQGDLAEACRTCNFTTHSLPMVIAKQHQVAHRVPPHSVDMITNQTTLQYIQKLIEIDQQLYDYALTLFHDRIEMVKNCTGVDLLCRDPEDSRGDQAGETSLAMQGMEEEDATCNPYAKHQEPFAAPLDFATVERVFLIVGLGCLVLIRWCQVRMKARG